MEEFINTHGDKAICLVGDFNCVRNSEERRNCLYRSIDSKSFNDFIEANELFDIQLSGSNFTWCGPAAKMSKLDRVLLNWEFFSKGSWKVEVLGRKNSDHRTILLFMNKENWGAKPFKIFECWLKNDQLMERVKDIWKTEASGNFHQKIRHIRK